MSNLKKAFNLNYKKKSDDSFLKVLSKDFSYDHFNYREIKSYLEELVKSSQASLTVNVDGLKLQNKFFPDFGKKKDIVFLSHSSKDFKEANDVKKDIERKTGLSVFIDSNVWGFYGELVSILKAKFSNDESFQTTFAITLLLDSLRRAIYHSKYFIFLNTDNSYSNIENETSSMFIYYELNCVNDFLEFKNKFISGMEMLQEKNESKPEMTAKFSVLVDNLCPIESVDDFIKEIK